VNYANSYLDMSDAEYHREEARQADLIERQYQHALLRNPDCRDPDHPGCEHCADEEDDDGDLTKCECVTGCEEGES